jgi:hypothetical protein
MEGGNIYLQPAKDLISQPLRNSIVKAGGNINMACKKHIDLSSSEEGLRLKSEKSQYFYSNGGGVVVEANGETDTPGSPDPETEAIDYVGGIVLKSKLGIYNYAQTDVVNYAKNRVLLQSIANTDIISGAEINVASKADIYVLAENSLILHGSKTSQVLSDGAAIVAGAGSTALGQKDQYLAIGYDDDNPFVDPLKGVMEVSSLTSQLADIKKTKEDILTYTIFESTDKLDALKFKFLDSYRYGGDLQPEKDAIPSTLAQQDDLITELYSLEKWEESKINDTYPYPGVDLFENFYISSEEPANLEPNDLGSDLVNKSSPDTKPSKLTLDSLLEYKVQP